MKYLIVIEKAAANYCAFAPDVPGCIATGATVAETRRNMEEALAFHLEGLAEDGLPAPEPVAVAEYVVAGSR